MTQNNDVSIPYTFADQLKRNNKFCGNMLDLSGKLISKAKAIKNWNSKERKQLLHRAERALNLADKAMKGFDAKYAKELEILSRI